MKFTGLVGSTDSLLARIIFGFRDPQPVTITLAERSAYTATLSHRPAYISALAHK